MPVAQSAAPLLDRLSEISQQNQLSPLDSRLEDLADLVALDLARVAHAAPRLVDQPSLVERGAHHLLAQGGKRLRPVCVVLASRLGSGFDARALSLAIAVELVHSATLLHDDVVDFADLRRGAPATRALYGNAISIFAGDWLLIEALDRVRGANIDGTLARLLSAIQQMILAESRQLELRGRFDTTVEDWFSVVEGKTAALFCWAMYAGARAGGLGEPIASSLEQFGRHLGIAFQATDDLLDLTGDPDATGKALFADLREGKLTYPIVRAMDHDPSLRDDLRSVVADPDPSMMQRTLTRIAATPAIDETRVLAREHAARAEETLARLPASRARDALVTVARTTIERSR